MKSDSISKLIKELVAIPSQGGVDTCDLMIAAVSAWLKAKRVPFTVIYDQQNRPAAVVATVIGAKAGPIYCLDACLDTATVGDTNKWKYAPFSAQEESGWLYGRGASDSKAAVAIFCHLAAHFQRQRSKLNGTLHVLFDADEHTGRFGGVKEYLAQFPKPAGVMIGYPGKDVISSGARGFFRTEITVHGQSAHSGSSSSPGQNAVVKASALVSQMVAAPLPGADASFALPAKLTVTEMGGGKGYTAVPDVCRVKVDCRLTPAFDAAQARALIVGAAHAIDTAMPTAQATAVVEEESWPPYVLAPQSTLLAALSTAAAEVFGKDVPAKVAGPSNIGNYLAGKGIETICGFGVTYKGLHATDECIELATIAPVLKAYKTAVEILLSAEKK